jgi:hypothetical protein
MDGKGKTYAVLFIKYRTSINSHSPKIVYAHRTIYNTSYTFWLRRDGKNKKIDNINVTLPVPRTWDQGCFPFVVTLMRHHLVKLSIQVHVDKRILTRNGLLKSPCYPLKGSNFWIPLQRYHVPACMSFHSSSTNSRLGPTYSPIITWCQIESKRNHDVLIQMFKDTFVGQVTP